MTAGHDQFDSLPTPLDELCSLIVLAGDGELTEGQVARLEELVVGNDEARLRYALLMHVQAGLWRRLRGDWKSAELPLGEQANLAPGEYTGGSGQLAVGDDPPSSNPQSLIPNPSPVPFIVVDHTLPSPLSSLPSFLFSYTVATVIFVIAGLCGWLYQVEHYTEFARSFGTPSSPATIEQPARVGRITGMVECRWETEGLGIRDWGLDKGSGRKQIQSLIPNPQSPVRLGDKFALASGLLQLTYDSGANVILQGPCTYEVDSAAGGFLSLGKLTAKVGEGSRSKVQGSRPENQKSEIRNHKSPSLSTLHSPLFTIKTPTAVVTDLGTEFGVEVDKNGVSEVQVLQGRVRAEFFAAAGQPSQIVQLSEGERRRYQPKSGQVAVIPLDRAKFERMRIVSPHQRWQAYSRQLRRDPTLLAYYTFEKHDRGNAILPNQSSAGSSLDGVVEGAEWVYGRLPGKLALYFHGPGSGDKVLLPEQKRFQFTGSFSIAVWFRVEQFTAAFQALVTKGDRSWRLQRHADTNFLTFDTNWMASCQIVSGQTAVADGRWHLAVAVYEPAGDVAHMRLYTDGRLEAENQKALPLEQNDSPVWLGANSTLPGLEFYGVIDEAAIFARALSAEEVAAMFQAGSPAKYVPAGSKQGGSTLLK